MPNEVKWWVKGTVIYVEQTGDYTIKELIEVHEDILTLVEPNRDYIENPLYVIFDQTKIQSYPSLWEVSKAVDPYRSTIGQGWLIFVSNSPVQRMILSIVSQVAKTRTRVFLTLEQASEFIKENVSLPTGEHLHV